MKKVILMCFVVCTVILTSFSSKKNVNTEDFYDLAAYDAGVLLGFNDAVYHLSNAGFFSCVWSLERGDDVKPDVDPAIHPQVDPFHLNRWVVNSCAYTSFTFYGDGSVNSGFINWRNASLTGLDAGIADPNTTLYYRSRYLGQKVGIDLAFMQARTLGQGGFIPPF